MVRQDVATTDRPGIVQGRTPYPAGPFAACARFILRGETLHSPNHQGRVRGGRHASTARGGCWPPDDRLIRLDQARPMAAMLSDHPCASSMPPGPGRRVARNPKLPLPRHGADSRRLRRNAIGGPDPLLDRTMGAVHERPRHWGRRPTTVVALTHVARGVEPCRRTRALRTHETVRPSALGQGFEAGLRWGAAWATTPAYPSETPVGPCPDSLNKTNRRQP